MHCTQYTKQGHIINKAIGERLVFGKSEIKEVQNSRITHSSEYIPMFATILNVIQHEDNCYVGY